MKINYFFPEATIFSFYKKIENKFFLRFWLFLIIYLNISKMIFFNKKVIFWAKISYPMVPYVTLGSWKEIIIIIIIIIITYTFKKKKKRGPRKTNDAFGPYSHYAIHFTKHQKKSRSMWWYMDFASNMVWYGNISSYIIKSLKLSDHTVYLEQRSVEFLLCSHIYATLNPACVFAYRFLLHTRQDSY